MKLIFLIFVSLFLLRTSSAETLPQNYRIELNTEHNKNLQQKDFHTLKEQLQYEFENMDWIQDSTLKTKERAMPYNLGNVPEDASYLYAQADEQQTITAELAGLGELNYAEVEYGVLQYCTKLSQNIQAKSLVETDIAEQQKFLQYFFPIILAEFPEIKSIFYACPEITEDKITIRFRCNFSREADTLSYAIADAVAITENNKWVLYEFQIGKQEYEKIEWN